MKKITCLMALIVIFNMSLYGCANDAKKANPGGTTQQQTTGAIVGIPSAKARSTDDFANELKKLSGATTVEKIIYPENNEIRYPFVPLKKDGNIIGYGSWFTVPIYQHYEDVILVVNPDGTLQNFMPIDAGDKHPEIKDENWRKKFFGMTAQRPYDPKVDVSSGSTYSSNIIIAELRNSLVTFDKYIKPNLK